jgi:hypothetical protein
MSFTKEAGAPTKASLLHSRAPLTTLPLLGCRPHGPDLRAAVRAAVVPTDGFRWERRQSQQGKLSTTIEPNATACLRVQLDIPPVCCGGKSTILSLPRGIGFEPQRCPAWPPMRQDG